MNIKTTLALMVLVGAGVLLWWVGGPELPPELDPTAGPAPVADKGTREFLTALKPDKIARIEVSAPRGVTALSRKADNAWTLSGNWPIRDVEVNALVDLVAGLRTRFEPQPLEGEKSLAEFGLDRPVVTVKLTVDGEEHTLAFGEKRDASTENRFSRDTYLRLDKKPEVVRLAPGLIAALDKPADYYQQRRLFEGERVAKEAGDGEKVERLKAQSVSVADKKPDGVRFTLEHRGSAWELAEPVRDRVETTPLDALLAAVPDIWAEEFVPLGAADVPSFLGILRPRTLDDVARTATDIFFATQGGLLVRSGLIDPERTVTVKYANGDTVTLQIGGVSSRRVKLVPAPPQPGMPPGLPPRMMPVAEEYRYAKLQYNERIFQIKADKLKDVFVALNTLRDSHIARFNITDARRVEIRHGSEDIVLEKDKENWKIVKPLAAEADNAKVTDLLTKLSELQARDKDILDKDDPKKYGFDKPDAVVTVTVEEEIKGSESKEKKTRTLTVRVGKHDADKKKLYVMSGDWPRINIVDESLEPLVNRSALAYRGKRLFDFSAADAAKIDIDNRGKKLTLEQDKGAWRLTSPAKAQADAAKVDGLLADLGHLEASEFVNQKPTKDELDSQYGLAKSPLTVRVEFADKKKPAQVLHVGKASAGKGGYFARVADEGPVFTINAELHERLASDSLSYRPQMLWQIQPEDVASLRIHKAGQTEYTLTHSGTIWKLSGPFETKALAESALKMAAELGTAKVENYKAHEAKSLAEYGLDKPALTVGVAAKDGKEHTLLIGKPSAEGATHYAKRSDDPAVFTVGATLVHAADRPALDLIDTRLLNVDAAKVERLHSQSGDKSLTLEKKADVWRATESPAGAFTPDPEATLSLNLLWSDFRAQRFAAYGKNVDWAKYGLDKPAVRVTIKADANEHTIELGKEVEGELGARYVRVDKGAGAAVLPIELARLLDRTYLDYVNHDLLKFDGESVTALERHMGTNVLEVVKTGDNWEVTKPVKEKADGPAMQQLFDRLGDLHAERIAAYPAKDLQTFGLDAPSAILTIKLKADQKPSEYILKLGKTTGNRGERFALVDDGKVVAVLSGSLCEQLTGGPIAFRDRAIARFADADLLQLERGPRKATFGKVGASWKLIEPLQGEAEQDALDELVRTFGRLRADMLVADKADAEQLKKYGLDRPVVQWRVQAGGKDALNLLVGDAEPKGERRYAKLANGGLVFLLDPLLSRKVLDEYRPRTVWSSPLDAVQIESLNYRYKTNPFLLEKAGSAWQVVGKPDAKILVSTVEDTLAALAGLKLSRYVVDKGANLALFGLDKPDLILEVATRSGKRVLHIGNVEGDSKGRYARVPDGERGDVFVLDEETCARLMRNVAAFGRLPTPSVAQPAR
jgi:hypothetical protein